MNHDFESRTGEKQLRYEYRFNKKERGRLAALESILADTATGPKERLSALRAIERIEATARRRSGERENLPEPAPATEPTVDELVSVLEAQKQPVQLVEPQGLTEGKNGQNGSDSIGVDLRAADSSVTPQPVPEAPTAFCGFCSTAGNWNTTSGGVILCPTCFAKVSATEARHNAAAARARAEQPADWAEDFAAQRNVRSSDFEKSRALWAEQDREN